MTGLAAVFIDAWEQLKLQRVRVLMSLIGVTLAVAALTASLALGNIMAKSQEESMIRASGPAATYSLGASGTQPSSAELVATFRQAVDRYGVSYATPVIQFETGIDLAGWYVNGEAIDPAYFAMHGRQIVEGRGFVEQDSQRLAPVAVVSQGLANQLGLGNTAAHPTIDVWGTTVVVVGVVANLWPDDTTMYVPVDSYLTQMAPSAGESEEPPYVDLKVWLPPEADPDALANRIASDMESAHEGLELFAQRVDAGGYENFGPDPATITTIVLASISVAILALGALSLINIAVVTVRYRIREFGIRRAFGASRGRIFVGVMMESVVGTFVAGVIGVGIVAVVYRTPMVQNLFGGMNASLPAFPVDAAIAGIIVSILTGVVAGMIPAIIAVRARVIDAIRF